jgi:hypothetical protein
MQTVSFPELTSGNQSTQSVSLPEISAVNQSVKEVAGAQSVQVNVDQSMEENGQTVAEGSDNGGTIVYSGSEGILTLCSIFLCSYLELDILQ